jgi:hypothetical protein
MVSKLISAATTIEKIEEGTKQRHPDFQVLVSRNLIFAVNQSLAAISLLVVILTSVTLSSTLSGLPRFLILQS